MHTLSSLSIIDLASLRCRDGACRVFASQVLSSSLCCYANRTRPWSFGHPGKPTIAHSTGVTIGVVFGTAFGRPEVTARSLSGWNICPLVCAAVKLAGSVGFGSMIRPAPMKSVVQMAPGFARYSGYAIHLVFGAFVSISIPLDGTLRSGRRPRWRLSFRSIR